MLNRGQAAILSMFATQQESTHLNLGHTTGGGGDAYQVKLSQHLVVCRHLTLSLEHLDADLRNKVCAHAQHEQPSLPVTPCMLAQGITIVTWVSV